MAILEKKLDRPSGTLGCPIDELARMLGTWYVLGGGRSVAWALQAHCGVKKRLLAWPQNGGCGKLKTSGPIRLEGVKKYPSGYSHFFTGRMRLLGGPGPSAPQWARFRLLALWPSATADMGALGQGKRSPGPLSQPRRSPSQAPSRLCRRAVSRSVLARVSRACSRHTRHTLQRPARTSQCSRF